MRSSHVNTVESRVSSGADSRVAICVTQSCSRIADPLARCCTCGAAVSNRSPAEKLQQSRLRRLWQHARQFVVAECDLGAHLRDGVQLCQRSERRGFRATHHAQRGHATLPPSGRRFLNQPAQLIAHCGAELGSARRSGQQIERNAAGNGSRIGRPIVRVYRLT